MKRKTNASPFRQLLKAIENEVYDFELECKCHNVNELSKDFVRGYRTAINNLLIYALSIYNRGLKAEFLVLDCTAEATTQKLLAQFKKEG